MKDDELQDQHSVFTLTRADQLRALGAAPTHDAFLGLLKIGEGSISDIARTINKTPHSLYHHMDKLIKTGLVLEAGARRSGARTEVLYRPVAHLLKTDPDTNDPDYLAALAENARASFRRAGNASTHALTQGLARRDPDDTNLLTLQITVPLSDAQRQQLVRALRKIIDDFAVQTESDREAPAHMVTLGLSPLE